MPINLDSYLGNLGNALELRGKRAEVLASNMANADTPNYKARDFDFQAALGQAQGQQVVLRATAKGHIKPEGSAGGVQPALQYRIPNQPSLDGNSVDIQLEKSAFTENAVQYQATLSFLDSRIKGLKNALRGE
jgi:flagellar basal-body rod protein FlgB